MPENPVPDDVVDALRTSRTWVNYNPGPPFDFLGGKHPATDAQLAPYADNQFTYNGSAQTPTYSGNAPQVTFTPQPPLVPSVNWSATIAARVSGVLGPQSNELHFQLDRTKESKDAWVKLLRHHEFHRKVRVGLGTEVDAARDQVEHLVEQVLAVGHVDVERGGAGAELGGHRAHGHAIDALLAQDAQPGLEHGLA